MTPCIFSGGLLTDEWDFCNNKRKAFWQKINPVKNMSNNVPVIAGNSQSIACHLHSAYR